MSGWRMGRMSWLMNGDRPIGVKQQDGVEIMLPFLSADGLSLIDASGNAFTPVIAPNVQKVVPVNGDTVQMLDTGLDGTLFLAPAAALTSLNIILPTDAKSRIGQIRRIAANKAVTGINLTGAATMLSTITGLAAGDCVSFLKIDANTWTRIV